MKKIKKENEITPEEVRKAVHKKGTGGISFAEWIKHSPIIVIDFKKIKKEISQESQNGEEVDAKKKQ